MFTTKKKRTTLNSKLPGTSYISLASRTHAQKKNRVVPSRVMRYLLLFLLGTLVVCAGCVRVDSSKERELDLVFRYQDSAHQIEEFKKNSFCRQIDLYLYAMKYKPSKSLAMYLAANGDAIVPTLLNRLDTERDEENEQELIDALQKMSILVPSLRANKELIEVVRRRTREMKDQGLRQRSEKSLELILSP